jgi:hypothetical protein
MKKIALLLLLTISFVCYSQIPLTDITIYNTDFESFDISKIADDSTYWFRIRGKSPIEITIDFTDFSGDTATVDFFKGWIRNDSVYFNSIDGLISGVSLPLTLVKATYLRTSEGDSTNEFTFQENKWNADLVGFKLDPNSQTGTFKPILQR